MPRLTVLIVATALAATACVAGADVVPADPDTTSTFEPVTTLPGLESTTTAETTPETTVTTQPDRASGVDPAESVGEPR